MKAGLRLKVAALAAGLLLAAAPALAQNTAQPPAAPPPADTVGPRELQNFNLDGTVTRPAEASAATTETARPAQRATTPPRNAAAVPVDTAPRQAAPATGAAPSEQRAEVRPPAATQPPAQAPAQSVTLALPPATQSGALLPTSVPEPGFSSADAAAPVTLAPERSMPLWPWFLLALVLGGAAALFLRRRQMRQSYAGGSEIDAFVPREPEPRPQPQPVPPPAPPETVEKPKPVGLVSSRLRPWLDIEFAPVRCVVEHDKVTFDFVVNMFNSGSAPARDVLIEARIFNAGPDQEQQLNAFYAQPPGPGERTPMLPPLQRLTIQTSLFAERQHLSTVDLAGRKSFVPLIAFNVSYRAPGGLGRTSACFMLGSKTKADKLAPFRAEEVGRAYPNVGAVALPQALRV
ncbi:MAG TPA: hypothetical protein VF027_04120 [Sphingomicrobium sp.]